MSRFNDIKPTTLALTEPSQLPAVDWSLVGQSAPTIVSVNYTGPDQKLPKADAIVMTWTGAEWGAMDHVFIRSGKAASPSAKPNSWYLYGRGAPADSPTNKLWGYYQLVRIGGAGKDHTVLLFKSDAHLAHPPYLKGLAQEVQSLVADVEPSRVYSIGTAGGATDKQNLGDVVITNGGACQLKLKENSDSPDNNKTFTCTNFFPNTSGLLPKVQKELFYKLSNVATMAEWQRLLTQAQRDPRNKGLVPYSLDDLMNAPIEPANLGAPKALADKGTPLLTTDTYFIAEGNMPQYSALEMDDGVIGAVANQLKVPFAFFRNISDAVVVTKDKSGKPMPTDARHAWSAVQYDHFGIYTSFNGALATWATLADW